MSISKALIANVIQFLTVQEHENAEANQRRKQEAIDMYWNALGGDAVRRVAAVLTFKAGIIAGIMVEFH